MTSASAKPSILILCSQFPPVNGTGARRPYYLARQLADEGHPVSILTTDMVEAQPWLPNTAGITVHRTPTTRIQHDLNWMQRLLAKAYWNLQGVPGHGVLRVLADLVLPEGHVDRWDISPAEVEQHLGRHDVVLATCPAWFPFRLAARLATRWKAMYMADYRDPWSVRIPTLALSEMFGLGTGVSGWLRSTRMRMAERRWAGAAFAVSAISPAVLENARLTTTVQRGIAVHGGYDPSLTPLPFKPNQRFTLIYTGRLYGQQDWGAVLSVIEQLHAADPHLNNKLRVVMYGAVSTNAVLLARMKEVASHTGVVELLPRLSRTDTMRAQQAADVLLHISMDDHQGGLPVKFLEYLGAGRPILLFIKKPDLESEVVERTRTGVIVNDAPALHRLLTERLRAWEAGEQWHIQPDRAHLDTFNYAYQMGLWTAQLRTWYAEFQHQHRS